MFCSFVFGQAMPAVSAAGSVADPASETDVEGPARLPGPPCGSRPRERASVRVRRGLRAPRLCEDVVRSDGGVETCLPGSHGLRHVYSGWAGTFGGSDPASAGILC